MENYNNYYNVLSNFIQQEGEDIQRQTTELQEKAGLKQAEQQGGVMGLFKVKELVAGKVKEILKKKFEEGVEKAKGKVEELKDKALDKAKEVKKDVMDKAQEVKNDVMGQVQEATEQTPQYIEDLEHIKDGDTMADVINDSDKFNEYIQNTGNTPEITDLFSRINGEVGNDEDTEQLRTTLKDILDNPEDENQQAVGQTFRETVLFPKREAQQVAEQQEFISPEITGAMRGDTTLARTLGLGKQPQEIEMQDLSTIGQTEIQQANEAIGKIATKETEETTGKAIGETVGEEAGEEVGGEVAGEIAGESVLSAIPGLDLLAPVVMLGSALSALFGHKKHELQTPQFNPSFQFL